VPAVMPGKRPSPSTLSAGFFKPHNGHCFRFRSIIPRNPTMFATRLPAHLRSRTEPPWTKPFPPASHGCSAAHKGQIFCIVDLEGPGRRTRCSSTPTTSKSTTA
jgi:hypothetical protein